MRAPVGLYCVRAGVGKFLLGLTRKRFANRVCAHEWFYCSLAYLFTLSVFGVFVADLPARRFAPFRTFNRMFSPYYLFEQLATFARVQG